MSFNKAKTLKAASKYVQQGKYQAAIDEYRRIAQAEPSDITTLNTMGDLYVKLGDSAEAIRTFLHIAEHYRAGSFNLKAIAMLKKVSKLAPNNIEVSLKLAGLYAQQKLVVDARQQYLAVAEYYLRAGQQKPALEIYQKIANLDPENTSIQLKLAEAYLHERQPDQAYEAFMAAAAELQRQGKPDEALPIYLKALEVNPEAHPALNAAVNLHIQRGDSPRAVALISQLLQTRPEDTELLTLLGRIHQSANELVNAEKALTRAVALDPSRFQYLLDLASLAIRNNDFDCVLRQVDRLMERLYERREEEKAISLLHEILVKDPSHFGALERLAAIFSRIREDHNLIETLNSLADAAIRKGEDDIAIKTLGQLTRLEPDEIKHRRRLRSLGLSDDEVQRLSDSVPSPISPAAAITAIPDSADDAEMFIGATPAPAETGLPPQSSPQVWGELEFTGFVAPPETRTVASSPAADSFGEIDISLPDSASDQGFTFTGSELTRNNAGNTQPQQTESTADGFGKITTEFDLSVDLQSEIITLSSDRTTGRLFNAEDSAQRSATVSAMVADPGSQNPPPLASLTEALPVASRLKLEDELESVDFYLAQGMLDVARHTIETLESSFPNNESVRTRRQQIRQAETAVGGVVAPAGVELTTLASGHDFTEEMQDFWVGGESADNETDQTGKPSLSHISEESKEIFRLSPNAFETDSQALPQVTVVQADTQDVQAGSAFADLLADLKTVPFDAGIGQSVETSIHQVSAVPANGSAASRAGKPTPSSDESYHDLFSIFDEIKSGTEEDGVGEDFDTHYNLGLAYKDMEMFDDAVEEFQQAYKTLAAVSSPAAAGEHQLLCCSMLGFCFSQKQMPRLAVFWLRKGLDVPGRSENEYQALRYDLAAAYEAVGDLPSAYEMLSEVYAVDVTYRGVTTRMREVQAQMKSPK